MQPLAIGAKAPDFTLLDQHGRPQRLSKLLETKAVVLYFYPQDETYGCTKEACHFRDQYEDFLQLGAEVVGISADSIDSHMRFAASNQLPFILLSDPNRSVHSLYGVQRALWGMMRARVTFVIDRQGIIRNQFDGLIDFKGHVTKSLAILKGLPDQ